jgi:hypothetical protein
MKYKLIIASKETSDKENILLTTISIIIPIGLIYYFFKDTLNPIILILIAGSIIWFIPNLIRRLYSDWIYQKDISGFIEFKNEKFVTNDDSIDVEEILEIQLNFNYIKGKRYNRRDIIHNGIAELNVNLKNGETKRILFLIETKEQFENLSVILKEYYKKHIVIKEFFCKHKIKTILLKPEWTFEELQNLKRELNLEKI